MTDTELKLKGFELLRGSLGMVELEKFISLAEKHWETIKEKKRF